LTEVQQQTLRAVVNRIIPADDYPGAWEAGIGHYVARQFEALQRIITQAPARLRSQLS